MTLSALDLLGPVVAALFASNSGRFDRLAIHYGSTGLRVPLQSYPHALTQGYVHPLPGSVQAPGAEVVVNRLPRWEVVRQESPSTTALEHVEDGVEDLSRAVKTRTPVGFGSRKVGFKAAPFGI